MYCIQSRWKLENRKLHYYGLRSAPNLFKNAGPACVNGPCSEGNMTCGKANEVREFYKGIKENG